MQKVIDVLNKKWSWILAFIPGVNILCLFFWFLTTPKDSNFSCLVPLLATFPSMFLCWILPDSWGWFIVYLAISVLSFMLMREYRGAYRQYLQVPLSRVFAFCGTLFFLLISPWSASMFFNSVKVQYHTMDALRALAQDDLEGWQSEIHPVYGKELLDMEAFKRNLVRNGVVLDEDIHKKNSPAPTGSTYNFRDGKASKLEFRIYMGGEVYRVNAIYFTNDSGSGLISLKIVDDFP